MVARYVNISFVALGLLVWVVLSEFFTWAFELIGGGYNSALIGVNFRVADLAALVIAGGLTIWARRDERVHTYAMEVGAELSKVTWPTWPETRLSTIVVVIVTIVLAIILAAFDYLWSSLSSLVYNV